MIDTTVTAGNIIQAVAFILAALVFYFKRDQNLAKILENHEVRIEKSEGGIIQNCDDIRDLYKTKVDKK